MKKALVIANMVFASAAVFGTPLEKTASDPEAEIFMIVSDKHLSETEKMEQVKKQVKKTVANVLPDERMVLTLLNIYKNKQAYSEEDLDEYIDSMRKKSAKSALKHALDYKKDNKTSLYRALMKKETNLAKLLVDLGADTNEKCDWIWPTPVDVAVRMDNRNMIKYLTEHGEKDAVIIAAINGIISDQDKNCADILDQETKGYIDFDIIKKEVIDIRIGGCEIADRQMKISEIFKKNNPNYDAKNPKAIEFLKYLVDDPYLWPNRVIYNMEEWLLEKGADPNTEVDSDGNTLLMSAVKWIKVPEVKYLIKYGANIDAVNSAGQTAYDIAKEKREYFQKRYSLEKDIEDEYTLKDIDEIIDILEKAHKEQLQKNASANQ